MRGQTVLGALAPGFHDWLFYAGLDLNARGVTGIILAGLGLANGVIDDRIFVAIVIMALATSLMAVPVMSRLLHAERAARSSNDAMLEDRV